MIVDASTDWASLKAAPGTHVVVLQASFLTAFYARAIGLEIRDTIAHAHTGGMETILLCRAPLTSTVADNVLTHGVGGLNDNRNLNDDGWKGVGKEPIPTTVTGRWPTNLVFTHSPECQKTGTKKVKGSQLNQTIKRSESKSDTYAGGKHQTDSHCQGYTDPDGTETIAAWACAPGCPVKALDELSGECRSAGDYPSDSKSEGDKVCYGKGLGAGQGPLYADSGTASRFFPQFQSRNELLAWLDTLAP